MSVYCAYLCHKVVDFFCSQKARERVIGGAGAARLWTNTDHEVSVVTARLSAQSLLIINDNTELASHEHGSSERRDRGAVVVRSLGGALSSARPFIHAFQGSYVPCE